MIRVYKENEFIVNGLEIREVEFFKEWDCDDTVFCGYAIEKLIGIKK